jgi:23S rRNA pseudouridine1911/1915/1917 synthase
LKARTQRGGAGQGPFAVAAEPAPVDAAGVVAAADPDRKAGRPGAGAARPRRAPGGPADEPQGLGPDADPEVDEVVASAPAAAAGRPIAERLDLVVEADAAAERLDAVLARLARAAGREDLSRSRLKQLVGEGRVRLDGVTVLDPARKVQGGAALAVDLPEPEAAAPAPEAIPLAVVYEDAELVVIDKPAGLVVHPGAGNATGTLVNALLHHCGASLSGIGGVARPGIVHRLDKETSGLMVVAKTDRAHRKLADQFADHGRTGPLERAYRAFVWGAPRRAAGIVDAPIGRNPRDREAMAVVPNGREAITHFAVLESYGPAEDPIASLVECRLETGRTHQIRVHMAHLGHPLLGDPVYGTGFRTKELKLARLAPEAAGALGRLGRQALHARLLAFAHPVRGKILRFESPLPPDLKALAEALRALGS